MVRPKEFRWIKEKLFYLVNSVGWKKYPAEDYAKRKRTKGYFVRIIPYKTKYGVRYHAYTRSKYSGNKNYPKVKRKR